ncbi:MAG: riboflavin synthase [Leptospirales bacterium]
MFSGIVQATGRVRETLKSGQGMRLVVEEAPFSRDLQSGESVAVNGACMTVTAWGENWFGVDVSAETLSVTRMGQFVQGERLNLERAISLSERLSGHLVLGHVDGLGRIDSAWTEGETTFYKVWIPYDHRAYVIPKGSITIDGISLTVNRIHDRESPRECLIELAIIPHTILVTNLADRAVGDLVHLEYDVIGKYILRAQTTGIPGVTPEGGVT